MIDNQKKTNRRRPPNSGKKAADGATGTRSRSVSIDPERERVLRDYGDGEFSVGVRKAADHIAGINKLVIPMKLE